MVKQMFKLSKNAGPEEVAAKAEDIQHESERLTARQTQIEADIAAHYGEENTALIAEYNGNIAKLNSLIFVRSAIAQELREAHKRALIIWYERQCISERAAIDGYEEIMPQIKEAELRVAQLNQQSVEFQLQRRAGLQARTQGLNECVDQQYSGDRGLLAEIAPELGELLAKYGLE